MKLSEEETDFIRLVILVVKVSTLAVRHLFNLIFPPSNLAIDLQKNRKLLTHLNKNKKINAAQWNLLFPPSGNASCSSTYDVTLLICLLRNMKTSVSRNPAVAPPATGFDTLPKSTDSSQGADLARIKHYRNGLAHKREAKVNKADFKSAWTDLFEAISRLGGGTYDKDCIHIKDTSLDDAEVQKTRENLENVKKELRCIKRKTQLKIKSVKKQAKTKIKSIRRKTKSELSTLNSKLKIMQEHEHSIPKHMKEKHQIHIDEWEKDEEKFTVTRATEHVTGLLEENDVVVVTGSSGSGKSSIIHHIALKLKTQGYTIIPFVSGPNEIIQYRDFKENQLFIIDDLCGKNYIDETDLQIWKKQNGQIEKLFPSGSANEQGRMKILASCRLQIYKDEKLKNLEIFTKNAVDLQSDDCRLLSEEKYKMIRKYITNSITDRDWLKIDEMLEECRFFPLLCMMSKDKKVNELEDLFSSPIDCMRKDIRDMIQTKPIEHCALVLCVLFPYGFHEDFIDPSTIPQEAQQKVTEIADTFEINLSNEMKRAEIRDAFDRLDGTYVKKTGPMYQISYDKLYDMMAVECCFKVTRLYIAYASPLFITEQFRLKSIFEVDRQQLLIYLNESDENSYFDRIFQDLNRNSYKPFFQNKQLQEEKYQTKVMEYISRNKESCDKLFKRLEREGMVYEKDDTYAYVDCISGNYAEYDDDIEDNYAEYDDDIEDNYAEYDDDIEDNYDEYDDYMDDNYAEYDDYSEDYYAKYDDYNEDNYAEYDDDIYGNYDEDDDDIEGNYDEDDDEIEDNNAEYDDDISINNDDYENYHFYKNYTYTTTPAIEAKKVGFNQFVEYLNHIKSDT